MILQGLKVTDYRNFDRLDLSFRPRLNFILGQNGQGKTNLLEAVYLLCRGTSFRPADSRSLLNNHGSGGAGVHGRFLHEGMTFDVDLRLEPSRKSASINGKKTNSATLMATFPVVLFSPESLAAIKEGPEQRRHLVDEILVSHNPRKATVLREFAKALKSRNRLLKNLSEGIGPVTEQLQSLNSLNKIYFLLATHLTMARLEALRAIQDDVQEAMRFILESPAEEISVDYLISGESALEWSESGVYDALLSRHRELTLQETSAGMSLVGPHKHDIKFLFAGNDSRFYCSQGQQRALILAFKIAQIVYHHRAHQTYPVLLLDDVLSELDVNKRGNLMKFLEGISAQILITATDLTWSDQFGWDRNCVFTVSGGRVAGYEPNLTQL